MKKSTMAFALFCMTLITALVWVWGGFKAYFSVDPTAPIRFSRLEKEVDRQRFNNTLLTYQVKDYEELVAQNFPNNKEVLSKLAIYKKSNQHGDSHSERMPASVDEKKIAIEFNESLKLFREKRFKEAAEAFEKFNEHYPTSSFGVQTQFFTAESYFLAKDYKRTMDQVDLMVSQFPYHELTGYILLRMGQISEINNQSEEAKEIYRTVARSFEQKDLVRQANRMLTSMDGHEE